MRLNYERKELTNKVVTLPSPEGERRGLGPARREQGIFLPEIQGGRSR